MGFGSYLIPSIMALWGGLLISYDLQIQVVGIYGDSKLVIGWLSNETHMDSPHLQGWIDRTRELWKRMDCPPIHHIYRENNTRADRLSKKGLLEEFGILRVAHFSNDLQMGVAHIPLP